MTRNYIAAAKLLKTLNNNNFWKFKMCSEKSIRERLWFNSQYYFIIT